jgi:hypothetical protein
MTTIHDARCRVLPDPGGEMVVFHGPLDRMTDEWIRCHETLLTEVER